MLRSLVLATFLLLTLLWTSNAWSEPLSSSARTQATSQTYVQIDRGITAGVAITGSNIITVTTTSGELNSDGDCSLREAIQAADTDSATDNCPAGNGGDTITLPPGNYGITRQVELTGTITLQGSITGTSIIDALGHDRVLYIHQDATAVLSHLDIRNGQMPESNCLDFEEPSYEGAGVANYGTTIIAHSTIHNNKLLTFNGCTGTPIAASGGGIFNGSILTVTDSVISDNIGGEGGSIYNGGSLTINNSTVSGNASSRTGGGIYNGGSLTVNNSTVSGNASGGGGCGFSHGGIVGCGPGWGGGGIDNVGTLIVNNSTISDNKAGNGGCDPFHGGILHCGSGGNGGGIYNRGILTVFNSTISSNAPGNGGCGRTEEGLTCSPSGEGGGVYNSSTLTLDNSTIAKNLRGTSSTVDDPLDGPDPVQTLRYGVVGGIFNEGDPVIIKNTIIANNQNSDCSGTFTARGNNLIQNATNCTVGSDAYWAANLNPLDDNGGPTLTHALNENSQAIDAGDCTDSTGAPVTLDQRGWPRPQGDGCDIGSYESPFTSTFTISTTNLPMIEQ